MPVWGIILIVAIALVLVVAVWYWGVYNTLVRLKNNNEEAFSTMDVYMKKRYDLVPNLVETVKGYAKHEKETLNQVILARNNAQNAQGANEKIKAEQQMNSAIRNIFALAESYPELKANANFVDLQKQLQQIESEIANSRKYYNACVKTYNTQIQTFPSSFVAKRHNFEKASLFELDSAEERKNVKVQF